MAETGVKVLSPKDSGEFVIQHAKDVSIDLEGVKRCAAEVNQKYIFILI